MIIQAKIIRVGTITRDVISGNYILKNWEMDCQNGAIAIHTTCEGVVLVGGYSKDELLEIASRKSEWEDS